MGFSTYDKNYKFLCMRKISDMRVKRIWVVIVQKNAKWSKPTLFSERSRHREPPILILNKRVLCFELRKQPDA